MIEADKTYIGKMRAVSSERDTLALQLRLSSTLSALDLHPPGLPTSAILCIRAMHDPLPGALRQRSHDSRPLYAWEQAVRASLKRMVERAIYPARDAVPASADAVIFTDQAEMLACLARDWCAGTIAGRWWWQGLFKGKDLDQVLVPTWLRAPEYIPAALLRLAAMGNVIAFARALAANDARSMTHSIVRSFGLSALQPLVGPFAQHSQASRSTPPAMQQGQALLSPPSQSPGKARRTSNTRSASAPTVGDNGSSSQDLPAPLPALRQPPWHPWVPEGNASELSFEQRCLLGTGLLLARAPAVIRTPSFARAVLQWRHSESLSLSDEVTAIEKSAGVTHPTTGREQRQSAGSPIPAGEQPTSPARSANGQLEASASVGEEKKSAESRYRHIKKPVASPGVNEDTETMESVEFIGQAQESRQVSHLETTLSSRQGAINLLPATEGWATTNAETAWERAALQLVAPETPGVEWEELETFALPEAEFETEVGGLFYLINLGLFLNLYGDFTTPLQPGISLSIWDFITLLGQQLLDETDDPIWLFLARMAGRRKEEPAGSQFDPLRSWRIPAEWLLPFAGEGDWRWNVSRARVRVQHPERFIVLDVPLDGADPAAQVTREMRAYAGVWNARARLVYGPLHRVRRVQPAATTPRVRRWLRWLMPYIRARLRRALGLADTGDISRLLVRHHARIVSTATNLDIVLLLAALPIEVRISGLDRNPGWVPAAGRFVAFHFE